MLSGEWLRVEAGFVVERVWLRVIRVWLRGFAGSGRTAQEEFNADGTRPQLKPHKLAGDTVHR